MPVHGLGTGKAGGHVRKLARFQLSAGFGGAQLRLQVVHLPKLRYFVTVTCEVTRRRGLVTVADPSQRTTAARGFKIANMHRKLKNEQTRNAGEWLHRGHKRTVEKHQ